MSLSCFEFTDQKNQLTLEEAQQALLTSATQITHSIQLPLADTAGLSLASDIIAPINVPQNTNAAMDGYAIHSRDLADQKSWKIIGESLAGQGFKGELQTGESVYITTGAPLPAGADTVVMIEQCRVETNTVYFEQVKKIQPGSHVRQAGEDIQQGQVVLKQGTRLGSAQLGLLASLGLDQVPVHQPVKVAVFSTGDEVTAPGQSLPAAGIYDANRFTLMAMLDALGCQVTDLGILPDNLQQITQALSQASAEHQLVLTSGGVSVGDADFVKQALSQLGETRFWRLAIRPGRPFAFGHLGQNAAGQTCLFAGLPGNPVATLVTFMLLVQPMIRQLQGASCCLPPVWTAVAETLLKSRSGRSDFHRGRFSFNASGQLQVRSTGAQGSGILTSAHQGNCLIRIPDDQPDIPAGDSVTIYPFYEWLPGYRGFAE
ncbi:MAG: molybdopterin molybdenumtransferase MoeA [Marinospirillum sp.]|uniref:molybdopterin molybdotransferase MoeA n=1 Tax=Marinospirillum sp. TaxID=2183934 RepID=UPI0019ECAFE6|nr:gephyrin-like molybdotransferase Glp [Marinospirillum sp.]MBE0507211.1 molybdopterin molybdenumtransferase MoeA [Marinospirillum sp.]